MNVTGTPPRWAASIALLAALVLALPLSLAAGDFPDRTIEVVIHSKYGGGTDTTARLMIAGARKALATDMVVVAKRGGSGAKAHAYVKSKPADGHTLIALTQTHLYTMARGKSSLGIDDIVGVARAMSDPTFVAVARDSSFKSLADLVAASKAKPLNWGVSNIGGTEHIGLARLARAAGFRFKVVPFGSGAQMVQQLMSGAIDATLPNVAEAVSQLADGSLRALAVMSDKRLESYPSVSTTFELGYPVRTTTTRGYAVLAGTPQPVIDTLSRALVAGMSTKEFGDYLMSAGLSPAESIAGSEEWDRELKTSYRDAVAALKELGLLN